MPKRSQSTTAIQALNLFNSPFVSEHANKFAEYLKSRVGDSIDSQVELAFQLALGRNPTAEESDWIAPIARVHGLSVVCRALFNSNEFLFIP